MPTVNRRQRKRRQTRDYVAEVAFDLFETHGFEAVTMEQIASRADVARGTVYNHFPVKEAVLAHAMHAQLENDLASLLDGILRRTGFMAQAATLLEASATWWTPRRHYLAPYIRYRFQQFEKAPEADESAGSDMLEAWRALIAHAQRAGELRDDMDAARLAHYLHFLYLSELMRWLTEPIPSLADGMAGVLEFFHSGAQARPRE